MPATVVGLSSVPECVAISHEQSGHTQLYRHCPLERLTFPIFRADSRFRPRSVPTAYH